MSHQQPNSSGKLRLALRSLARRPGVIVGITLLVVFIAVALVVPLLSPFDPNAASPQEQLRPPSAEHLLGTDEFGRDVLTRLAMGISVSVQVAFATAIVSLALGVILGLLAVFVRPLDQLIMRICDGLLAIPGVLLALAVVAATGASVASLIVCLILVETPNVTRLARSAALSARERKFVEASAASGVRPFTVVMRHVVPSVLVPVAVQISVVFGSAIIIEAALSFLGAGIPAPSASLGNMLNEAKGYINTAWWLMVFPGIALGALVLGANLIGDGIAGSGLFRRGGRRPAAGSGDDSDGGSGGDSGADGSEAAAAIETELEIEKARLP